jgi:hypothetical protein
MDKHHKNKMWHKNGGYKGKGRPNVNKNSRPAVLLDAEKKALIECKHVEISAARKKLADAELELTLLDINKTEKVTETSKAKAMHVPKGKGKDESVFQHIVSLIQYSKI